MAHRTIHLVDIDAHKTVKIINNLMRFLCPNAISIVALIVRCKKDPAHRLQAMDLSAKFMQSAITGVSLGARSDVNSAYPPNLKARDRE
jgi:hypothetical protein